MQLEDTEHFANRVMGKKIVPVLGFSGLGFVLFRSLKNQEELYSPISNIKGLKKSRHESKVFAPKKPIHSK